MVDAKIGFLPFRSRLEKVFEFCPLAEKRGSLEGVREGGFKTRVNPPGRWNECARCHYHYRDLWRGFVKVFQGSL